MRRSRFLSGVSRRIGSQTMASLDHGALDKNILLCMVQRVRPPAFLDAKFSGARHCAMFVVSGFPLGLLLWSAASRLVFRRVVSSFQLAFKFFGSIDCSALLLPCGSTVYYSICFSILLYCYAALLCFIYSTALLLYCSILLFSLAQSMRDSNAACL